MSQSNLPPNREGRPREPSLENVRVSVLTDPQRKPGGKEYAQRVARQLKGEVESAITAAAPSGLRAQFAAVQEMIKSALQKIDPNAVDSVKVLIQAEQGDARHHREYYATPQRTLGY